MKQLFDEDRMGQTALPIIDGMCMHVQKEGFSKAEQELML